MNSIKSLVKNTRAYKVYQKYKKEQEQKRVMQINYSYKEKIDPLMDPKVLKIKCDELEEINKSNHAKYYVIAQKNTTMGIFGYINCFLPHIAYAIAMGYIPVIDMQTYDNIYIPKENKQKHDYNAWESFFEQPMNIGLDDICGKNIIRCHDAFWYRWMPNSSPMMVTVKPSALAYENAAFQRRL